jgi:hypothetical protein
MADVRPGMTLNDLARLGATPTSVERHVEAGRLTFSRALSRSELLERLSARARAGVRRRPCITCGTPIWSEGPHHRMCGSCRAMA